MMNDKPNDPVNHPAHYTFGKYEAFDVLEDWFGTDPLLWQVGKYIARAGRKGSMLEDLEKAAWYLARRIAKEECGNTTKKSVKPRSKNENQLKHENIKNTLREKK
jgi:hypothetical protein